MKPDKTPIDASERPSFGVTYEGLKHLLVFVLPALRIGFGVTYEGLKLPSLSPRFSFRLLPIGLFGRVAAVMDERPVLELPMRV